MSGISGWEAAAIAGGILACGIFAPIVILTVAVAGWAWWRGWSPTRARWLVAGVWLLPLGVWLLGSSPGEQMARSWEMVRWSRSTWEAAHAWVPLLPWLLAIGMTNGVVTWAARWNHARSGVFDSPRKAGVWIHRQWERAMARARREVRRPGKVPMLDRKGTPVLGRAAFVSEAGAGRILPADPRLLRLSLEAINRHMVIVGEPGAGKTVLILRFLRGWMEAAWLRHVEGAGPRPLAIFVDCKGGGDGAVTADRFVQMSTALGLAHGRIGRWTGDGVSSTLRLDLWTLPPARLVEVLVEMVRSDHPFYVDIQDELVALAVLAPCGPPRSSVEFVSRLNAEWLLSQYGADRPGERESIHQNARHFTEIASRYRSTFRRIGRGLDSGRHLDDFDALVATLEGTANARTASAQAHALMELVTDLATRGGPSGQRRQVLLVIDEFSAISERVNVSLLMERSRSLGISVVPAGQSWASLGPTDDDRTRLLSAAAGGLLLMGTTDPEPLAALAGTGIVVETGIKKIEQAGPAGAWGDEGTGRAQRAFLLDPDWVRQLSRYPGQVAYVDHGTVTWGVVAPADISDAAPSLLPSRGLSRAVESRRSAVLTSGDRIPLEELEAGLGHSETTAAAAESALAFDWGQEETR